MKAYPVDDERLGLDELAWQLSHYPDIQIAGSFTHSLQAVKAIENDRPGARSSILISALLWPNSKPAAALLHAARYHELVLCDRNIYELRDVLERKAPQALVDVMSSLPSARSLPSSAI